MSYKGITKEREDASTGAPINFHRIVQYVVDERTTSGGSSAVGSVSALVAGYVSQAKFNEGRNPMGSLGVNLAGLPPVGVDTKAWIYEQITREAGEGGVEGPFSGGTLIDA